MSDMLTRLKKLSESMMEEYRKVQSKIQQIEDLPKAKALVGKYFKYKGVYHPKDGFIYKRVIGVNGINLVVDSFYNKDHYGKIEFVYNDFGYISEFNLYTEITAKEYFKAHKKILDKLQKYQDEGNHL
jgi:hypothetical protein